jgi:dihydroneopterin aldolase
VKASVGFEELSVRAVIGAHAHERSARQPLLLSLYLDYNAVAPVETDRIEDAVDYAEAAKIAQEVAENGHFHLLEALCGAIVERLHVEFPQVVSMTVEARKPRAIPGAKAALARLEWSAETPKVVSDGLT